jgi:hypothetical protein
MIEVPAGADKGRQQRFDARLVQKHPAELDVQVIARAMTFTCGQEDVLKHPGLLKWCIGNIVKQKAVLFRSTSAADSSIGCTIKGSSFSGLFRPVSTYGPL